MDAPACPHCGAADAARAGAARGSQRWRCRECRRHFTRSWLGRVHPLAKQIACLLRIYGMSLRRIGDLLGASGVSVLKWTREFEGAAQALPHDGAPRDVRVTSAMDAARLLARPRREPIFGILWVGAPLDVAHEKIVLIEERNAATLGDL